MERKTIDRAFAEKYLPVIYNTALERLGDAVIAKLACKRVLAKVQEAMDSNAMPAETVMQAWLVFITQDEAADMLKQMPPVAAQPVKRACTAAVNTPAAAAPFAAYPPPQTARPVAQPVSYGYADSPRTAPALPEAACAEQYCASPAQVPAASAAAFAAYPPPQEVRPALSYDAEPAPEIAFEESDRQGRKKGAWRPAETEFRPRKRPGRALGIILFGILIVVNVWFIVGLLCSRGILPKLDWGYSWFDTFVFKLFNL